jgi:predicted transcriptional regulator
MDVRLTEEQEVRLVELAARDGRSPGDLAAEAVTRYLDDEARFAEAVRQGIAAADRDEFVSSDDVWARVERVLRT